MNSHASSHHVLKSLAELSPELLNAKAAAPEKGKPQQGQALARKSKEHTIQPGYPIVLDTRGQRGWGINE